ncbi:hypothetical protein E1265_21005 [Streptomyces sp. 8K308]|uniref:hypothetical protein n=1 Tax=Streptomyces sp. 8K308 TaxID=2530388 RepID=UPI00104AECB0|nr:hypothetical protein [Streptomyces sp. 8K308]TDC20663.1 hypothetical protein E1265_21005 [Streptomyces sp. 8K308]
MRADASEMVLAGVILGLAFIALIAYVARVLQGSHHRLPRVIVASGVLIGTLPAVVYTLYRSLTITA